MTPPIQTLRRPYVNHSRTQLEQGIATYRMLIQCSTDMRNAAEDPDYRQRQNNSIAQYSGIVAAMEAELAARPPEIPE